MTEFKSQLKDAVGHGFTKVRSRLYGANSISLTRPELLSLMLSKEDVDMVLRTEKIINYPAPALGGSTVLTDGSFSMSCHPLRPRIAAYPRPFGAFHPDAPEELVARLHKWMATIDVYSRAVSYVDKYIRIMEQHALSIEAMTAFLPCILTFMQNTEYVLGKREEKVIEKLMRGGSPKSLPATPYEERQRMSEVSSIVNGFSIMPPNRVHDGECYVLWRAHGSTDPVYGQISLFGRTLPVPLVI